MSGNTPFGPVDMDVSPALLPLASQQTVAVAVSNTTSGTSFSTGDYKLSAQPADHADPGGGSWLICDGTAVAGTFTALTALIGAARPDARGRTLVVRGTNASVSSLLANDGVAVGNRRPQHRHTPHAHGPAGGGNFLADTGADNLASAGGGTKFAATTTSVDGGSGVGTDALDSPAFIVPGNLFIHT